MQESTLFFFCTLDKNFLENDKKVFTIRDKVCIIIPQNLYGDAPDSIAGERRDKHTVDGVPTIKHST